LKKSILVIILLLSELNVFAFSPIKEYFLIRNYSSKIIIITREYKDDPTKVFYLPETKSWRQYIKGVNLTFRDLDLEKTEIRILPYKTVTILDYYPMGNTDGEDAYSKLNQISFMEKMKSIFETLKISTEDGKKVITLDNLGDQIIKKNVAPGGTSYHLEIFDYDFVGKPASEW